MLVGVQARLKNGLMLRYRMNEGGITQREASERADVPHTVWNALENLRFSDVSWPQITKIAAFLDCDPLALCPTELKGIDARCMRTAYREATAKQLMAQDTARRLELPSPADVIETKDFREVTAARLKMALAHLTYREREVLKLRYGLDGIGPLTLEETGKVFKVNRERIRQIEVKALRKLQTDIKLRIFLEESLTPEA